MLKTLKAIFQVLDSARAQGFDEHGCGSLRALSDGKVLTIQGWALGHTSAAEEIELLNDSSEVIARAPIHVSRPDIADAFSDHPRARNSGFSVTLRPEGQGSSELYLRVNFLSGASAQLGSIKIEVQQEVQGSTEHSRAVRWSVVSLSPESDKVLFGKQGWLFLRHDTNNVIGQHTGQVKLNPWAQQAWKGVLRDRMSVTARLGICWLCLAVPDKESLYPEYLPSAIELAPSRPVHDFLKVASAVNAPVEYVLEDLRLAKDSADLFSKTDTHWNFRGAYVAYRTICRLLAERDIELDVIKENSIYWSEHISQGDLGSKVHPDPPSSPTIRAELDRQQGRLVFDNGVRNHGRVMRFAQRRSQGLTCVVFGESFTHYLLPFLKETFQHLIFVHTSMLVREILEQERPDVVLSLPLERFLVRVPDDTSAFSELHETARRKGGELPWAMSSSPKMLS
jgi:hypothetical protein